MKQLVKKLMAVLLLMAVIGSVTTRVFGQTGILNPADPIVVYNPQSPPTQPAYGQVAKWVKTNRLNWNTSDYKAYIYKGMAFRLKFPTSYQHSVNDGKTYPVFIFFHGVGERGTIYDNEFQLYHGGQAHLNAVNSGKFDGFLLYAQNINGYFNINYYDFIKELIENIMVPQVKVDINRIYVDGLSGGGASCWDFMFRYPKLTAACLPISASSLSSIDKLDPVKYTPIWQFQGGLDHAPDPNTTHQIRDAALSIGAQYTYTEYPTEGHGCWNTAWAEPDFYPFLNRAHKANPWPLSGRSEFCPGDPVNIKIGITAGFDGYEWRKDGVLLPGASSNELVVTALGTYDVRLKNGTVWSPWSPTPLVIKIKTATVTPPIQIAGLMSKVIPATDGNIGVTLSVPQGYASYLWQKSGDPTTLSTANTLYATSAGDYIVKVTEQFGCSSAFSAPFTVINANGPNKPDAAISLSVSTLSKTSLRLDWSDNPAPVYNETNFEVYQASQAGGPYKLIGITGSNIITYTATGLNSNTKYYYKVRAVNNTAAAAPSNEANSSTAADVQAPTAPTNLIITGTTRNSIFLAWNAATDDVAVTNYDIYINGQKAFVTGDLSFSVYNLEYTKSYNFAVKARDFANNASPFSNQVTGQALRNGLNYKYYTFIGTWNTLPDFALLNPDQSGVVPNVSITDRTQNDNFAFLWEGDINIAVAGTYTFRTNSDDGSKLYLGPLNGTSSPYNYTATALVNNDGLHGGQNKDGTITLAAGRYPIAMTFYEQGGGESMTVSWKIPGSSSFVVIPNSVFVDPPVVNGVAPAAPSNLNANTVSHKRIDLDWTDNSNNETGFEVWRSTNILNGFVTIGTTAANTISFKDSLLNPNTTYYYQVRAVGQYGESVFTRKITEANWRFNNDLTDTSGNSRTLTGNGTPTFDATNKMEGTHAVKLNGTSQSMNIPVSSTFLQDSYSQRTVSLWIRSAANTGNRIIFDIGGNDNGLALVLNNNTLIAGIASASNRSTLVTPYTSTGWNHVALVYNKNSLKLYLNGLEVTSNNTLAFSSINTTTNASRIGANNGNNAYNTNGGFFSGWIDNMYIFNAALSAADISALRNLASPVLSNATTLQLPVAPAAPSGLVANGISTSANQITWVDNAANEDRFELYRSANNNVNYILLTTLPVNTVSYKDSALFANSVYYYKLRAVNGGGSSAYSNEDDGKTGNNLPVITAIGNQYMRYGTQVQLSVSATDSDGETLSMQVSNLPSFASFTPTGNGTGIISFNSTQIYDQGAYNNITVSVTDQNSGNAFITFNMVVNNNYTPVIAATSNVSLAEKQVTQINLSASDQNAADILSWSFIGLPSFVSVTTGTGTAQLSVAPGYSDAGIYSVTAKVDDGNNGVGTSSFVITITDANPNKKIYVNFGDGSLIAPAPWNNTSKVPTQNDNFPNLKDDAGTSSTIGMQIVSAWQLIGNGTNTLGVNTGNNSGIYPDNVIRSAYYSNTTKQTIRIYGLDLNTKYNFTFFGSRGSVTDNRTTVYTIKGTSVSLNAAGNTANTVKVDALQPDADGTLTLDIKNGGTSQFSYLNAMVIESNYDDGSVPATPKNFAGQLAGSKVNLSWLDVAYNETSYEVHRSSALAGPYTLLTPTAAKDAQQYIDSSASNNQTYYYKVRALNGYGNSAFTNAVTITVSNVAPVLGSLSNVSIKNEEVQNINVTATDAGDIITLKATNLPVFASFTDNGNGTGVLHLAPTGSDIGNYAGIIITAQDDKGASSSSTISISVSNKDITSIYVNFNQLLPVGSPWNSFNNTAVAGRNITNLIDEKGIASGATITVMDTFTGANDLGVTTGNNSGVFPDDVMRTAYYETTTALRRIRITGLSNLKKYNLVFFGSRIASDNRTTDYSCGGKTVSLNAAGNTSKTVQINGLVPDASGTLEFTVARGTGSSFAYINALVIQSYLDNGKPLAPDGLQATPKSKTAIQLNWNDKSDNESGFEVYRSLTQNGIYTLVNSTGANVTTFMDQGLQFNTQYFYKIRAVLSGVFSDYSNITSASTFSFQVYVNFNRDNPAAAPWNNTNNVPQLGSVYDNLSNEQGNPTGIDITVTKDFSGENPFGMNTGNNSGVFPDNVIRSSWWLDANVTSQLKISGLNQAMAYSFVFFGSRDGSGDRTTVYTVNGKSVSLNCSFNINQTVQIDNIRPDQNGEVVIDISLGATSTFGYIGALVIQASNAPAGSGTTTLMYTNSANRISNTTPKAEENSALQVKGWPNPFVDYVNVSAHFEKPQSKIMVQIIDFNGKILNAWSFNNLPVGNWNQRLNVAEKVHQPGIYFLNVIGTGSKNTSSFKLLKMK